MNGVPFVAYHCEILQSVENEQLCINRYSLKFKPLPVGSNKMTYWHI